MKDMLRIEASSPWIAIGVTLAISLAISACSEDVVEEALGLDEPAALQEADLPNCSRVVNCCTTLAEGRFSAVVPTSVSDACTSTVGTAADAAIGEYQRERDGINAQSGVSDDERTNLLNDLQDQWQGRIEPGCRCFLEESVGTAPDLATPADCESFTTTGALGQGATCGDAVDNLINYQSTN
jgi:hypothetical protein